MTTFYFNNKFADTQINEIAESANDQSTSESELVASGANYNLEDQLLLTFLFKYSSWLLAASCCNSSHWLIAR